MALCSIIGRASSPVLPLAIRTVGSLRSFHGAIATAGNVYERTILSPKTSFQSHSYSSAASPSAAKKLIAENVIRAINSEIKALSQVRETIKWFPFTVQSDHEVGTMILTREDADESIKVELNMADLARSVSADDSDSCHSESDDTTDDSEDDSCEDDKNNDSKSNSNDDSDDSGDGSDEESNGSTFHMFVSLTKQNKHNLWFDVVASADNIAIESFLTESRDGHSGPAYFSALNGELKHALHKYLDIRGIKPSMVLYLNDYIINNKSEFLFLTKLRRFIEN